MFFHPQNLKSETNNPWFNILLHTQSIVCATVDSQRLEYLRCITLGAPQFFLLNVSLPKVHMAIPVMEFQVCECNIFSMRIHYVCISKNYLISFEMEWW